MRKVHSPFWMTKCLLSFMLLISTILHPAYLIAQADECTSATPVTVGTSCNFTTYTNASATYSSTTPLPGCASYGTTCLDVWFKVTVPASGALIFDTQTGVITDGGMAIYSGTCGSLTLIECDDDDSGNGAMPMISRTGLTAGSTIYIRFWEYGGGTLGTFGLCVYEPAPSCTDGIQNQGETGIDCGGPCPACPPPLTNDECAGALPLTAGSACVYNQYTNVGATASSGAPAPGCANYVDDDVWFTVVVPASGSLVIDTQTGGITDCGMAIYTGSCGSLTLLECDDDDSGNGAMPMISRTGLTPGTTLYIRFWEYGGDLNGLFGICAWSPPPPPPCATNPVAGNYCSTAVPICNLNGYCGNTSATYTATVSPTNSTDEDDSPLGDVFCGSIENNSWLSFVADATSATLNVFVSNCTNGWGIQMEIYTSTDCYNFTSLSNCWNPGSQVNGTVTATGLTIGQTYYLMIDGNAGDVCDYVISAASGVWTLDAGTDVSICGGNSTNLNGTGANTYSWSPTTGLSNPNIANPVASPTTTTTYTLTGTGGNPLCPGTNTDAVTITVGGITPTANSNSPICAGATLNLSATPAAATSYSWSGPNGFSSTQQNPVIAAATPAASGTYTVTVNAAGCTGTATVTVTVNATATVSASSNGPVCAGSSLNLSCLPTGATAYAWSGPNAFTSSLQNPAIASVTTAATGTYTVNVTISGGCTGSATVAVTVNPTDNPAFNYTPSTLCVTGTDTPATITGGATGTFSSSAGLVFLNTNTGLIDVSASTTGNYVVTFTTNGTCPTTASTPVSIINAPNATINYGGPYCLSGTDPLPTLGPGASAGVFSSTAGLSINASTGLVDLSASTPGTYTITNFIAATAGCASASDDATIVINPTPTVTAEANQTYCNGAAVALNTITGPVTGTSFTWSNSNTAIGLVGSGNSDVPPFTATNNGSNAITGVISITPNANGCTGPVATYTITVNPAPTVTTEANQTWCNGAAVPLNTISSTVSGTSFSWTNSNTAIGLAAGSNGSVPAFTATNSGATSITGIVSITPTANTCVGPVSTYTITVSPSPEVVVPASITICPGATVPLSDFTSTTAGTSFAWTNTNTSIGLAASGNNDIPAFTAVNNGSLPQVATISVTPSANGCDGSAASFTITVNPLPTLTFPALSPLCDGVPAITLGAATPAGGTYSGTGVSGNNFDPAISGTGTFVITYTYTDAIGCVNTTSQNISVNPIPTVTVSPQNAVVCAAEPVTLTASGATTYTWAPAPDLNTNNGAAVTAAPLYTTTYVVTGTANGCSNSASTTVTVNPLPVITFTATPTTGCEPLTVDFDFVPSAEVMPNSWTWNFASLGSSTLTNPTFTFTENGAYVVTLSAKSADGCNISAVTTITVHPVPVADFGVHPDVVNTNDPQVNFDNNSTDATIWTWNFGDPSSEGLNYSALQNPVHDFITPGTYTIELAVANQYGCVDSTARTVVVREPFIFWIPNAFSPNGDMVNDFFGPSGTGIKEETFLMRIFDRWGEEIYFTVDFNAPWDGRNMRNGKKLFHGVFTYQIYIVDYSNHPHEFVGSVTLIE